MQPASMLLFDSDLGPSTVESLRLTEGMFLDAYEPQSPWFSLLFVRVVVVPYNDPPLFRTDWSRLRSLVLQCSNQFAYERVCEVLEIFPKGPKLAEVTVEWADLLWIASIPEDLRRKSVSALSKPYERLERALLRFSEPRIVWTISRPVTAGMKLFWTQELGKHFPTFSHRNALTVRSEMGGERQHMSTHLW